MPVLLGRRTAALAWDAASGWVELSTIGYCAVGGLFEYKLMFGAAACSGGKPGDGSALDDPRECWRSGTA